MRLSAAANLQQGAKGTAPDVQAGNPVTAAQLEY